MPATYRAPCPTVPLSAVLYCPTTHLFKFTHPDAAADLMQMSRLQREWKQQPGAFIENVSANIWTTKTVT